MNTVATTVPGGDCFTCDVNAGRRTAPGGTIYSGRSRTQSWGGVSLPQKLTA